MKIVPDTSVIIDGRISSLLKEEEYKDATIIIPEAVIAELESQANQGRDIGLFGLAELQELSRIASRNEITLKYVGSRPSLDQVKLAGGGEIDAIIRNVAIEYDAKFVTSDVVQSEVAKAKGLDVEYLRPPAGDFSPMTIDRYFDENTMVVVLKERALPIAKKGTPGNLSIVNFGDNPLSEYELRNISQEIIERAKRHPDGFIEMEKKGITVVQIGSLRISISKRPFSDGTEITAVRSIVDISLKDYSAGGEIKKLFEDVRGGIIIAGPPGSGKTSLSQSVAIYLSQSGHIVKTIEMPRELQVPDQITQLSSVNGNLDDTAEMMMLVRPDFVIFDNLWRNRDFNLFSDLCLAGIGMIGSLHASSLEDAVHRLISRIDFGLMPKVAKTMIFVDKGEVAGIYSLDLITGSPESVESGRCLVLSVHDSKGRKIIEAFRSEGTTVVMPLVEEKVAAVRPSHDNHTTYDSGETEAEKVEVFEESVPQQGNGMERMTGSSGFDVVEYEIKREIGRYTQGDVEVRMSSGNKAIVFIDDRDVPAAIGKGGKNVAAIVSKLGVGIDIRPQSELEIPMIDLAAEKRVDNEPEEGIKVISENKQLVIICPDYSESIVDVFAGKEYLFTATVNTAGEIQLAKNSTISQELIKRYEDGEMIRLRSVT